jgi:peptidyl-tRNA hydrolase, PTH1 family
VDEPSPRPALLFGLGNPGRRYEATRHNVGWQVLEALAKPEGAEFRPSGFFDGEEAVLRRGGRVVRLVRPTTFMNLCGPAYVRALDVHGVAPGDGLVVLDDFMLPFGRLRLRASGSSGGHNGLKSIQDALGGDAYPRLRVGIGPVPPPMDPAAFVLQAYDAEQRRGLPDVLTRASLAVLLWLDLGLEAAANRFNGEGRAPGEAAGGGGPG